MKYEWRKKEKDIYLPKAEPILIEVPKMKYFIINGEGDPNNSPSFQEAIEALYGLSYTIKMMPKNGIAINNYYEYTVYPLEGVWDIKDKNIEFSNLTKNNLVYSLMIRQPDFVTEDVAKEALELVKKKKPSDVLNLAIFKTLEEGLCVQMMHIGHYDDEDKSFNVMEQFCKDNNLARLSKIHKEIYLSDPRKVTPNKMKTVLRFKVKKN